MVKSMIKEIIIMLLLCLTILLLLGILLYEYVPMTKTIPNPVSYTTPNNVRQELADSDNLEESEIIMTYEVDATDLNNYSTIQNYKPGKANPFSSYETTQPTNGTNTTAGNSSTKESQIENNTNDSTTTTNLNNNSSTISNNEEPQTNTKEESTTTSGGQFFQDKGTK